MPGDPDSVGCGASELQQAWYLQRTYLTSLAAGVQYINWYIYSDPCAVSATGSDYGVIRYGGNPRPALVAFSGLTRHLQGATFTGAVPTGIQNHYAYLWTLTNQASRPYLTGISSPADLLVVWCNLTPSGQGNAPVLGQQVLLPSEPLYVEDMWGASASNRITYSSGNWYAQAGEEPLYIYIAPPSIINGRSR